MFNDGISRIINSDDLSGWEGMEIRELQVNECTFFLSMERVEQFKVRTVPCAGGLCSCLVALLQVLQVIFVRVDR